ncbi:MAG: hypothetical protein GQ527_03915 [Bacteroidales bacterium]|nr:hypothetical protein [Bacteroidales bacterium]
MNIIKAFFRLIRWPNLLMIVLAQILLQYMVISPVFSLIQMESPLDTFQFILLILSTVFMAAFGYAYNDVQDVAIDEINKNQKRVIDTEISKKAGLRIAWGFLIFALIPALYLTIALEMIQLFLIHIIIAVGLWYYSIDLKKKVLSGNLLISFFTAFSIFIVWLYHLVVLINNPSLMVDARKIIPILNTVVLSYTLFAFIISFIRELIKDAEDIQGDRKHEVKTFAVVFGIEKTKMLIYVLSLVMLFLVVISAYYTYVYDWIKLGIYLLVAVGIPLIYLNMNLNKSKNAEDFSDLSTLAKIIMVAGILSMQLFYISY